MSSFWKIKHKETGLFYQPARGYKKNSLSKRGKVYHLKPSLKHISHGYHRIINKESVFISLDKWVGNVRDTWIHEHFEVVEFKIA